MTQQAKGGSDKVEDLLKPRYKVIADYPGNIMTQVGDVLTQMAGNNFFCRGKNGVLSNEVLESYPHLFKPLAWYEEREASEMPEYVKYIHDGRIYKISDADEIRPFAVMFKHKYIEEWVYYLKCLPATEADYNQYIKTINK